MSSLNNKYFDLILLITQNLRILTVAVSWGVSTEYIMENLQKETSNETLYLLCAIPM